MYSRISGTKNGRDSIRYAEGKGRGHNGHKVRNLCVVPINMVPDGKYADQMGLLWRRARRNHRIQTRRIVISFSKKELNPLNEQDVDTAVTIVKEFIRTYYPDRQAVLYFQRDGRGGCLHCHAIVNDVSLSDHKGCTPSQRHYKYVRKGIDAVASKYIHLDRSKDTGSKRTLTERVKAEKAQIIKRQRPDLQGERLRNVLIAEKAYSYKDEMKQRIHHAMLEAKDEKQFLRILKESGIDTRKKHSKIYGDHYVYDFVECPISVKNKKARSYKLGYSYGPEAANIIWKKQDSKKSIAKDAFSIWMEKQGKTCFEYDQNGKIIRSDFNLLEELYEEYLLETAKCKQEGSSSSDRITPQTMNISSVDASRNPVNPKSKDIIRTDLRKASQIIKNASEIIARIETNQAEKQKSKIRHNEAAALLDIKKKGDYQYERHF